MAPVNPMATEVAEETVLLSDTVHVEVALLPSVDGLQATPVNCADAAPVSVNTCEPPLRVAVICVVWFEVIAPTVAVNPSLVWPVVSLTLAGTVMLVLLLESVMVAPPDGAGADNVTVQFADPGAFTVAGEHVSEPGWTVTVKLMVAD